jgi:NAD(P)-dependent dehydrogenase (short-subunit alcohol dehydrogenase family)
MGKLDGKTALVTGGSSGIGLATARLFVEEGARVALTGRDPARLESVRRELAGALVLASDAGRLAEVDALVGKIREAFDRLDVLVVNAGGSHFGPAESVSEDQFDAQATVHFKGAFFTIQRALPLLGKGSSIIVTTSIANRMGSPNFAIYAACKAAQRSLVQTLALELAGRGIRVNAVCPGPIETAIWGRVGLPPEAVRELHAFIAAKSPVGRWGTAEEVARLALFLASSDSSYVSGEEIAVDGAMSAL